MSDVVIIGGGAVGSSIAYFLASNADFRGKVTVVERDPTYRYASSALSLSSIRVQFSTPTNMHLSAFGMEFLKEAPQRLAVDGESANVGYIQRPYMFLASAEGRALLEANYRAQSQAGYGDYIVLLEPKELKQRFPWLNTDGIVLGSLGIKGEGWFDGYGLLQAYRKKARSLGVTYVAGEVVGIERKGHRIEAVKLGDGTRIACGIAVNAAGPSGGKVARLAGVDLPVEPRRRSVFVFDCREKLPGLPLLIDSSGAFFRPEGQYFIGGISPPEEWEPEVADFEVNHAEWDELVWPPLAHRVPALEAVKVVRSWAGHYDYNTFDHNGILGLHVELDNFMLANGFSGHGIQQSPASGRGISELITYGKYRTLDLSLFGHARIVENRPVKEINVV
ncbi:MAG TPA: FAD-binding oxidoreductase [Stellaceae bacterium]|nr:FAD-binding oxidoreductase [Stellaceae bacterium]